MKWKFEPASHIDDYLRAIAGSDEFFVKHDVNAGIVVINYQFTCPTTFPDPMQFEGDERRRMILRRDCRGLKFDIKTGLVVAKPYHKFHNCNEKPDTQIGVIDWSRPHRILEKLDGSMITPYMGADGLQWHTKMGPTDVAKPVYAGASDAHRALSMAMIEDGRTAIFEWCSRQQRIVIDYPVDRLVLTAVRHNVTGEYLSYPQLVDLAERFDVPVVTAFPGDVRNAQAFLDEAAALEGTEGFVVRFDDGHMLKVKGLWYCRIHNIKELFVSEKNVWNIVLTDGLDDITPFMDDRERSRIENFSTEFNVRLRQKADHYASRVARFKEQVSDKKRFALEIAPTLPKPERGLMFSIWDGKDPYAVLKGFLAGNVSTQSQVDGVRFIVDGLAWNDFYGPANLED